MNSPHSFHFVVSFENCCFMSIFPFFYQQRVIIRFKFIIKTFWYNKPDIYIFLHSLTSGSFSIFFVCSCQSVKRKVFFNTSEKNIHICIPFSHILLSSHRWKTNFVSSINVLKMFCFGSDKILTNPIISFILNV